MHVRHGDDVQIADSGDQMIKIKDQIPVAAAILTRMNDQRIHGDHFTQVMERSFKTVFLKRDVEPQNHDERKGYRQQHKECAAKHQLLGQKQIRQFVFFFSGLHDARNLSQF